LTIGHVRMKSYLPSRKIYLSQTNEQNGIFSSPGYDDFTKTLELYGDNNNVFDPLKYIAMHTWVCIAIYSLRHFSATLPWSSCGTEGQELVWRQFHIMHMSNDLQAVFAWVALDSTCGILYHSHHKKVTDHHYLKFHKGCKICIQCTAICISWHFLSTCQ